MSIMTRCAYLLALVLAAAVYVALMPPEAFSVSSFVQYLIPATGVGLLFVLAKGALGYGLTDHIAAIILVVGVLALVSIGLSSAGLLTGIKEAADLVGNFSNGTNTSLPVHLG